MRKNSCLAFSNGKFLSSVTSTISVAVKVAVKVAVGANNHMFEAFVGGVRRTGEHTWKTDREATELIGRANAVFVSVYAHLRLMRYAWPAHSILLSSIFWEL